MAIGTKANIGRCVKANKSHRLLPKHLWNLHPDVTREVISGRRSTVDTGAEWEVTPSGLVLGPTLETIFYRDTDGYPQPQNPPGWTLWTYGWHIAPPSSPNAYPCMLTLNGTTGGSGGDANRVYFEGDFHQWSGGHFDQFTSFSVTDSQAHNGIPVVLLATRVRPPNDKVELIIIDSKLNVSVYEDTVTWTGGFTDDPGEFDFLAGRGAQICGWTEQGLSNLELLELATNPHALFEGPKMFALADPLPDTRLLDVPQVWTKQPPPGTPIDRSNPLTRGLFRAITPTPGVYVYNAAQGKIYGLSDGSFTQSHNQHGRAQSGSGTGASSTNFTATTDDPLNDRCTTAVTQLAFFKIIAKSPAGIERICTEGEGTGDYITIQSSPFNISAHCRVNSNGPAISFSTVTPVNGQSYIALQAFDRNASTRCHAILKSLDTGVIESLTDNTDVAADFTGQQFEEFAFSNMDDYEMVGYAAWNRKLSAAERESIIENPWQIFKRDNMHVPIEYQELTFDSDSEERLFMIPQKNTRQPR